MHRAHKNRHRYSSSSLTSTAKIKTHHPTSYNTYQLMMMIRARHNRVVLLCIAACGVLSLSVVFLSTQQVKLLQASQQQQQQHALYLPESSSNARTRIRSNNAELWKMRRTMQSLMTTTGTSKTSTSTSTAATTTNDSNNNNNNNKWTVGTEVEEEVEDGALLGDTVVELDEAATEQEVIVEEDEEEDSEEEAEDDDADDEVEGEGQTSSGRETLIEPSDDEEMESDISESEHQNERQSKTKKEQVENTTEENGSEEEEEQKVAIEGKAKSREEMAEQQDEEAEKEESFTPGDAEHADNSENVDTSREIQQEMSETNQEEKDTKSQEAESETFALRGGVDHDVNDTEDGDSSETKDQTTAKTSKEEESATAILARSEDREGGYKRQEELLGGNEEEKATESQDTENEIIVSEGIDESQEDGNDSLTKDEAVQDGMPENIPVDKESKLEGQERNDDGGDDDDDDDEEENSTDEKGYDEGGAGDSHDAKSADTDEKQNIMADEKESRQKEQTAKVAEDGKERNPQKDDQPKVSSKTIKEVVHAVEDVHKDQHHHHDKKTTRPPLDSLISDTDRGIKGHVSFLLDWAVIGHAKTGTSFFMKWLNRHPEVATWNEEVCDLFDNRPAFLVKRLYEELPEGDLQRGFKCPAHFSRRAIRLFKRYFHKTKIIVGVRHPVRWFESFYNFRTRHGGANYTLPEPNKLIGVCTPEMDGICTDRANFHTNLAVFGKTNMSDPVEQNLIRFRKYKYEDTYQIDNPIFLYDVGQFYDNNTERMETFKTDLQHYLGLQAPMPEPTKKDAGKSSRPKPKSIDICTPEWDEVRKELVAIGKRASMWIRKYFLKSDQVVVSSRERFEEIVKEWKEDPCLLKVNTTTTAVAAVSVTKS